MSRIKIDEPSLTLVTETLFTVTPSSLTTMISPYYSCPSCIGKVIVSFVFPPDMKPFSAVNSFVAIRLLLLLSEYTLTLIVIESRSNKPPQLLTCNEIFKVISVASRLK